jgi:hypothetical protein
MLVLFVFAVVLVRRVFSWKGKGEDRQHVSTAAAFCRCLRPPFSTYNRFLPCACGLVLVCMLLMCAQGLHVRLCISAVLQLQVARHCCPQQSAPSCPLVPQARLGQCHPALKPACTTASVKTTCRWLLVYGGKALLVYGSWCMAARSCCPQQPAATCPLSMTTRRLQMDSAWTCCPRLQTK